MLIFKLKLIKAFPIVLYFGCVFLFSKTATAQCNNQIGVLQVSNFQHKAGIFICYNDTLKVEVENYTLADSQQLYYVYHNEPHVFDGNTISVDTLKTDGFVHTDFAADTLYVTAIISKAKSYNWLEDSCAVFSNTIEATFLSNIASDSKVDCNTDREYCINLQITGGLPKLSSLYNYMISGYITDTLPLNKIGKYKLNLTPHDRLKLYIIDENGCRDTLTKYMHNCGSMPIDLLAFNATITTNGHLIKWVTASQINVDHFLLEVSKDGNNFEVIGSIDGQGTTANANKYEFNNQNLASGVYKYKLSTVSGEGIKWELGTVELINYTTNLHPNPAQSILNFHFSGILLNNINLQVYDLIGRRLQIDETHIERNPYGFDIDISTLANGIYFALIQTEELERIEKFVVEK